MAGCPDCHRTRRIDSTGYRDIRNKCHQARGSTCEACEMFLQIELKIESAGRALYELLEEREKMVSTLNEYHDPFIRRLPVELSSQILLHCLPYEASLDVFTPDKFSEEEHIKAVFRLEHICRNWRDIARGTPQLWNIFSATIVPNNAVETLEIAQKWLERSGGLDLFIKIFFDSGPRGTLACTDHAHKVTALAILSAKRWRVLNLQVPSNWAHWISISLSNTSLPLLEHLLFGATDRYIHNDVLNLKASPIRLTMYEAWLEQISMRWDRLTQFSAPYCTLTVDECIRLFRDAPCLRSCSLEIAPTTDSEPDPEPLVVNSSMCNLVIREPSLDFWPHFALPSLQVLDIVKPQRIDEYSRCWIPVRDFLRRSGCEIKDLTITDFESFSGAGDVVSLLQLTPSLERLSLKGEIHARSLFSQMNEAAVAPETADPVFMGRLRELPCVTEDYRYDWSLLAAFLNTMVSRTKHSLQSFELRYQPKDSEYDRLTDPETFRLLVDVVADIKYRILCKYEPGEVQILRCNYGYEDSN